ncbi:MAG: endoribonuclease MazF [Candidatus Latescibacteria bacterium]|nr:endoribonuclease MazF [bacterium]MBD3423234.1 endoribonuclease MazF [Candidatus Latescibacterota bacterium]
MVRRYVPDRGDLVWLQFNPQVGNGQSGIRPALVISPKSYNSKVGLALFCQITEKVKGYPFEVDIPKAQKASGAILSDQIISLDWRVRKAKKIQRVPDEAIQEVLSKIESLIRG